MPANVANVRRKEFKKLYNKVTQDIATVRYAVHIRVENISVRPITSKDEVFLTVSLRKH